MDYINKEILNYRITKHIGEGGMAGVFEAEHLFLDEKKVAVKILDPVLARKEQIASRFLNEAKIMARLKHPNIVEVVNFFRSEDTLAIIMELLQGETLDTFIKRNNGLSESIAYDMSLKILRAFDYAHGKSLVHRDVKPSNIFVEENKNIKIMDFGIAKLLNENLQLTSIGTQMGTPVYMSPEQVRDTKNIDRRSDLYSFGVMLYFMLQGSPPYNSGTESKLDIFNRIVKEPLPRLTRHLQYQPIIDKATAKNPVDRYQTAAEFLKALQDLSGFGNLTGVKESPKPDRAAALKKYDELFTVFYEDRHISDAERRQLDKTRRELNLSPADSQKIEDKITQLARDKDRKNTEQETTIYDGEIPDDDITSIDTEKPEKTTYLDTNEKEAWKYAQWKNTEESYNSYLEKFPEGKYAELAKQSLSTLQKSIAGNKKSNKKRPIGAIIGVIALFIIGGAVFLWQPWNSNGFTLLGNSEENKKEVTETNSIPKTSKTILKLAGSAELAEDLIPELAKKFLKEKVGTQSAGIEQKSGKIVISGVANNVNNKIVVEPVSFLNEGFQKLKANNSDIIFAGRKIMPHEKKSLSNLGNMTSDDTENVIANDGISIIVNKENTVSEITISELADVFSKRINNWSQLGGSDKPITIYSKPLNTSIAQVFKNKVMDVEDSPFTSNMNILKKEKQIDKNVGEDPSGIGFVSLPNVNEGKKLKVKSNNSVLLEPTLTNIKTEDYILSRRLYCYIPENPSGEKTYDFRNFTLSEAGQALIENKGYGSMKLSKTDFTSNIPVDAPQEYKNAVQGKKRLTMNIRFKTGSYEFDNKAFYDLGRLYNYLIKDDDQNKEILLVGFSDSRGGYNYNVKLSIKRAKKVQQELSDYGISASVRGFGPEVPVGDNSTEEGRKKNRRVEIWIN